MWALEDLGQGTLQQGTRLRDTSISGTLVDVLQHRDSFFVGRIETTSPHRLHMVKGSCLAPQIGASYTLYGAWDSYRGAPQFHFTRYDIALPTEAAAVVRYLAETAKWIGPSIGRRIVSAYGEDAMAILKGDPVRVARDISGITLERAQEIQQFLVENERLEQVTIALTALFLGTGLGRVVVQRALERWQHEAMAVIEDNPFLLCELDGVGFLIADRIRADLGVASDSPTRLQAAILHVLTEAANSTGGTYLCAFDMRNTVGRLLQDVPIPVIEEQFSPLQGGRQITVMRTEARAQGQAQVAEGYEISLRSHHDAELAVAHKLTDMARIPIHDLSDDLDEDGLFPDQVDALHAMARSRVFVLTGGPGTGKTHLIQRILDSLPRDLRVALAAPTGKAAKRISEQTGGREASTIHRLLEPQPMGSGSFRFTRNRNNPLDANVVILDECSMIEATLMADFLDSLPTLSRLIMIGDPHQLPSVGPGSVLRDVISSGVIPAVELNTIKRADEAGWIVRNLHRIRNGQAPHVDNRASTDFFLQPEDLEEKIASEVVDMVATRLPRKFGADPLVDVQVVTPRREDGLLSAKALNERLQARLNPNRPAPNQRFALGDKVIQTKNDYELCLFNGDVGHLLAIDNRLQHYITVFDGRQVIIPWKKARIELAYALTCHKFQGSEAPFIVIPIHQRQGPRVLQRPWVYTAISRAKKVCVIVGQEAELANAVKRTSNERRYTKLEQFLREAALSGGSR